MPAKPKTLTQEFDQAADRPPAAEAAAPATDPPSVPEAGADPVPVAAAEPELTPEEAVAGGPAVDEGEGASAAQGAETPEELAQAAAPVDMQALLEVMQARLEAAEAALAAQMAASEASGRTESEAPPDPETPQEFLDAPLGTVLQRVREQNRRGRTVMFCTRRNYQQIIDEGGSYAEDLARHAVEVDTALFVRMNESDEYLIVDDDTGRIIPTSKVVKTYIPKYENFDDRDLAMVAAMRGFDTSNLDRQQLVNLLQAGADHRLTIDQELAR